MAGKKRKTAEVFVSLPTRTELLHKISQVTTNNSSNYKRDRALITIEYLTGARVSELLGNKLIGNPGVIPLQIELKYIAGAEFMVINNVKVLKRRTIKHNNFIINIKKEQQFVDIILDYLKEAKPDEPLFNMTRQHAWRLIKKFTGYYNHFFRHLRATHLTTDYGLTSLELKEYFQWGSTRMAENYSHLNKVDLARKMAL